MKRVLALLCLVWLWPHDPAAAQVYQLGNDGTLGVREGGGAVIWHDARIRKSAPPHIVPAAHAPVRAPTALLASAKRYHLDPVLLDALVRQESGWHLNAHSPKGAFGLTQLMPATALALGVDAHDPQANLDGGAHYLRLLLDHYGGDVARALAAYNAGYARVDHVGGVPAIAETQHYVRAILASWQTAAPRP
ncbi:MAG: lytic transglycosylase domain-containing protein [Alphaproteobacteria bacterium]|nr:lytic transglycosylase domain-containing protein [Alphaproteobacteria bacterium]MDE2042804.1 lytic transglycosylase domain-containing protein [Alphaproteobacteria bacterium]MDE2339818.1 lytic transglycosylase domain-containing protein [Alphaproteobacteria bacterium]